MPTEDLIQVGERPAAGAPVATRGDTGRRLVCRATASLGLVMVLMGVRRELGDAVDRSDFAIEAALLIVTAVSAAVGALLVSIPGAERARLVRLLPLVAGSQPSCGPSGSC